MISNCRFGINQVFKRCLSRYNGNNNKNKIGLTGGQVIYQKLIDNNVEDVFMYTGGAIMPLIDAFAVKKINYFINTHEQSLGHSATGYAKSTNKTGVCIVTSGPGLTNMVTPIVDANNDSTPLVIFSGQVPKKVMGSSAFQECPSTEITKSITKWNYCVQNIEELPYIVDKAFQIANTGKKGVVHIDLPKCVTSSIYTEEFVYKRFEFPKIQEINNIVIVEHIARLINNSMKPVIIVGKGCVDAFVQLRELINITNIPVTSTIFGMGILPDDSPMSLGFMGMHGNVAANYAIQNADLIINLGSRFDDRTTGNTTEYGKAAKDAYKNKNGGIVHVNVDDNEIRKNIYSNFNVVTKCSTFLDCLIPLVKCSKDRKEWLSKLCTWKNNFPFNTNTPTDNKLCTQFVIDKLGKWLNTNNPNFFISTGVGNHQMMSAQFVKWNRPNQFLTSGSLGVMGTGLPYAVGAQIANPGHLVLDIDGDGSFNHTLAELKTIASYNLPVKIAIMNDGELSMVKAWEHLFFGSRYVATNLGNNPDYVALAESFGIPALRCDSQNDLDITVDTFLSWDGPVLCDFKVKSDLCLPLVKPGKALDDMFMFGDDFTEMKISEVPG